MLSVNASQLMHALMIALIAGKVGAEPSKEKPKAQPSQSPGKPKRARKTKKAKKPKKRRKTKTQEIAELVVFDQPIHRQDQMLLKVVFFIVSEIGTRYQKEAIKGSEILIPIQAFIDAGIYKEEKGAARALKRISLVLGNLCIEQKVEKDAEDLSGTEDEAIKFNVFPSIGLKGKNLAIVIPWADKEQKPRQLINWEKKRVNWKKVFNQFSYAPDYLYRLSPVAFRICLCACLMARMENQKKSIRKTGAFEMNVEDLARYIGLPVDNKRISQLVINPILEAIKEIRALQREYKDTEILISGYYPKMKPREILEQSIHVTVKGETRKLLKAIPDHRKDKTPNSDEDAGHQST